MGFGLGSIVDAAKGVGKAVGGYMLGGPVGWGAAVLGQFGSQDDPSNPQSMVNSVDPRLKQMRDEQIQQATDYKKNMPGYQQQQQRSATDTSRQQLAQDLAGVSKGSNARGMLYGSYNQGKQAQATAQNAADLQRTKAGINTGTEQTLSQLQNQALGTGMNVNATQQAQNALAYQIALQRQQASANAQGGLLGGVGSIMGRAMG